MTYRFAAVRTHEDEDSSVFPIFSAPEDPYVFETERGDGSSIKKLPVTALYVHDSDATGQRPLKIKDIKADLFITDSRVVFCCEKFDKGGGWTPFGVGALPLTLALNAVSKARARHRRKGKMLAGHARYQWVGTTGGHTKAGFGSSEQVRISVNDGSRPGHPSVLIDLTISSSVDSQAVAQEIAQRVARFRLAHQLEPEHVEAFQALAAAPKLTSEKGTFALHRAPHVWYVKAESAEIPVASP